ncbi:helix-turn-helix domain-containing protein [Leptospirillum ferriphilum]|uniref:helix-turn-helix domain-containing protein n=1 Tax=Leptospirillum ferriphilum TaxID=178606 RepID=UPI0006B20483|nr:helix-turn-helix domain-containing protein [Leptospirillum ferriphilum]
MRNSVTKNGLPPSSKRSLEELGRRLRLLRKSRGYSRDRLAALAFIGRNTLARMESGDPAVSIGAWAQVIHVLGIDRNLTLLLEAPKEEMRGIGKKGKTPDINVLAESL